MCKTETRYIMEFEKMFERQVHIFHIEGQRAQIYARPTVCFGHKVIATTSVQDIDDSF